jgi:methylase of polypeptide subunit release factors
VAAGPRDRPLDTADRSAIDELGQALRATGLSGEAVRRTLRSAGDLGARPADVAVHQRRLGSDEPLETLIRLFVLELGVPREAAERALAPLTATGLEQLGVVASAGGDLVPLIRIVPHDETLIASDVRLRPGTDSRADHVAGVQGPSLTLSHLTVRRPAETALDIGTGCGIQAILNARTSGHVVATDLNERALAFAEFNALLNGVDNVELRAGSLLEPVAGEAFDLVTCNPPYVLSPESAFLYRDSGMRGDTVSHEVLAGVPAHLTEGAFATTLVSWAHPAGEDWTTPLRAWVEGSGCDAWLLHYGTDDPLTHAAKWNREQLGHDSDAFGATLDRWLEYFRELGIDGIAYGAVVLRRREAGENWIRADEMPLEGLGPASDHIVRVFEAADFLARDPDLQRERFALAERSTLEQRAVLDRTGWALAGVTLTLDEGVGFEATLDPATAELLAELDGRRSLGEVIDGLAPRQDVDPATLAREALPVISGLLGAGFLVRWHG